MSTALRGSTVQVRGRMQMRSAPFNWLRGYRQALHSSAFVAPLVAPAAVTWAEMRLGEKVLSPSRRLESLGMERMEKISQPRLLDVQSIPDGAGRTEMVVTGTPGSMPSATPRPK